MADVFTGLDPRLRRQIRREMPAAIIPVGSLEQHGPHLPVGTDSELVTAIAGRVGRKIRALVLPTINYGVSFEHAPFFQVSVRDSTLRRQLVDTCNSLASNGIKDIFIINGHHGNQGAIRRVGSGVSDPEARIFAFSYWHFMDGSFDHAGFVETSLMLAVSQNVRMGLAEKGLDEGDLDRTQLARARRLASKSFPQATKNGVWGDPRRSTKRDGRRILSEITENLAKKCQTCLTGQKTKLHQ